MREKIKDLEELKDKELYIIEDSTVVENNILKIIKEKGITLSDLSKITGISRQNINSILKSSNKKPGIDFCLKVSYVLNMPVEQLFYLTDEAWVIPAKEKADRGDGSTLYLDAINLEIIDNDIRKNQIAQTGYEYFDIETSKYLTADDRKILLDKFIEDKTPAKLEDLKELNPTTSLKTIRSMALEESNIEFNQRYTKIYKKLGVQNVPYQI